VQEVNRETAVRDHCGASSPVVHGMARQSKSSSLSSAGSPNASLLDLQRHGNPLLSPFVVGLRYPTHHFAKTFLQPQLPPPVGPWCLEKMRSLWSIACMRVIRSSCCKSCLTSISYCIFILQEGIMLSHFLAWSPETTSPSKSRIEICVHRFRGSPIHSSSASSTLWVSRRPRFLGVGTDLEQNLRWPIERIRRVSDRALK
jgi:hypothetical protein